MSKVTKDRNITSNNKTLKHWSEYEQLKQIEEWSKNGLTNIQIAINIGINRSTFQRWINENDNISDILIRTREVVATEVENALVKNALGHITRVMKNVKRTKVWHDERGKRCSEDEWIEVYDEVYTPPNAQAQIFYLKNKRKEEFQDRVDFKDESANEKLDQVLERFDSIEKQEE